MFAALSSSSVVMDTVCIKKKRKEVKKIETGIKTNQQQHNKNSVGNIVVGDSDNNRDTNFRYYVSIDIGGKKNCVACVTDKDGLIVEETKYGNT